MSQQVRTRGGGTTVDHSRGALSLEDILENPGLLKLELMTHGLRLDEALVAERVAMAGPSAFATAFELDLVLESGTAVTAPVHPVLTADSPYALRRYRGAYRIVTEMGHIEVALSPTPLFYGQKTAAGVPFGRFSTMHGGYLALSPISECQFLTDPDRCHFCSLQGSAPGAGTRIPVDDVVAAVRAAQRERPIQTIYLSVGYMDGDDSGVSALEPYVRALKRSFNVLVAVDALPPATNTWVDRTYAMGVDSISYNLEIYGAAAFGRICPGPARRIGRQRYLDVLSYATTVFNEGAVVSHLIVGLEPLEDTLAGIDDLVDRRVVPVLPIFRPFKGIDMRHEHGLERPPITTEDLSGVYAYLYTRLLERRIPMGWVRDMSVVTTPMEGRFFVGQEAALVGFFKRVFADPHRKPSPRWVDIRRALRVREPAPER